MKRATKKVTAHKKVKEEPKCTKQEESPPEDPVDEPPGEVKSMDSALFEGLCDGVLSALCLLQTSVSEVMDVKDEMIQENVPSCVQAQLSLSTSRLFRSLTDLYVPATELVRLVRVFGPQWEQKRVILEQLQGEHERLQRLLALTLQRVQHLESQSLPSHSSGFGSEEIDIYYGTQGSSVTTQQELGEVFRQTNGPWKHMNRLIKYRLFFILQE